MKFLFPAVHRRLISFIACSLLFVAIPKSSAATDDPISSARPAANAWLSLIDNGQYANSYIAAGDGLHQTVNQDKWTLVLKSMRPVWGELVSRTEDKHLYQPNGIQGLNGECMVISYNTSFKKLPQAMEMVILRFEDGKWRGVGYTAGPKASGDAPNHSVQQPVTETSTTVHNQADSKPAPPPAKSH